MSQQLTADMLPSFGDHYLIKYEVDCAARQIRLWFEAPAWSIEEGTPKTRTVLFDGVEGYHLESDAFGNIVLSLETVPVRQILSKHGPQIAESFRLTGAFGSWPADLGAACDVLESQGVRGFVLEPTMGLMGWILAKAFFVTVVRSD